MDEKKITPVANGKVRKNPGRKFKDAFISSDVNNVGTYIMGDIIIPSIKKGIYDIITNGIDMLLFNGEGKRSSTKRTGYSGVSYRSYYDDPRDYPVRRESRTTYGYSYDDIVLNSRSEAEDVLRCADEIIDRYHILSVLDLYDLCGIQTRPMDNKYGWTDISTAEISRVRDGYTIKLPKAMPIN